VITPWICQCGGQIIKFDFISVDTAKDSVGTYRRLRAIAGRESDSGEHRELRQWVEGDERGCSQSEQNAGENEDETHEHEMNRDENLPPETGCRLHTLEQVRGRATDELTADIDLDGDTTAEEFDSEELETVVFAGLLAQVLDEDGSSAGTPLAEDPGDGEDLTPSEAYAAGLQGVLEDDPEEALQAFAAAWAMYEDFEDPDQQRDAVTAGVALLAHVEIGMLDADAIDRDEVVTAVAVHRRRLSAAATALFDACMGETPSVDLDELRPDADVEPEDLNRGELEAAVLAGLLEHLLNDGTSGGEAPGESDDETEPGAESGAPDELRSDYETGLEHTEAGERQAAIGPLMDAWDRHDSVGERGRRMAYGAGVALAVHVADDGALSMVRDEVLEVLADDADPLSTPAHTVFEATTGGDHDGIPAELREFAADRDGLDALEARAFAELLGSLTDDPRAEDTGGV
jgi:hypothetical protein